MKLTDNMFMLTFAEAKQPEFMEKRGVGYIEFGSNNDYPGYLLDMYNKSAKHNAIVRGKVNYITGNGWATKEADPAAEMFIKKANDYENLNDLTRKVSIDIEVFGGAYLELIWSEVGGMLTTVNHIDYTKIRSNKDNTSFWYKKDWKDSREKSTEIPAFNTQVRQGKQILYIKEYRPGMDTYALPGYMGALNYILSDVEVSKHVLGNAQTGFSASKLITLPNGEPSNEEKGNIEKRFEKRFTGADGKKFILNFVTGADRKAIVEDLGTSDLTKEDFGRVDSMIQQNIFAGHQITTPSLFGIAEPGKMGTRTEMRDGYEIFKSTYCNDKQQFLESVFNMLARLKGATQDMYIQPVEPIGFEFSEQIIAQVAPKEWILEKMGIDPTKYGVPAGTTEQAASVNEHLKGLKGREWQNMQRIIREFTKGKITRDQAIAMLKGGYALSDDEINTWLGSDEESAAFSKQMFSDDDVINVFAQFGEDANSYAFLKKKKVGFKAVELLGENEALMMEFKDVMLSELEKSVVDLITKDKRITAEILANVTKTDLKVINDTLGRLEADGILKARTVGGVIERSPSRPLSKLAPGEKAKTTGFLVRYSYEWKSEVPTSERDTRDHPSRAFCKKLMSLNRLYSRADIEQITARLGYSVFDRGGGWWTQPDGNHSPSCRHTWMSNIVIKKD
jgi:hypothetical protein